MALGPFSQELMIGLGIGCIVLPTIFIILRLWARKLSGAGLVLSDWLCICATVFVYTCSSLQLYAAIDGRLGRHQNIHPDGSPILDDPEFLVYERAKLAINVLSPIGFGVVKASILVMYGQIFHNIKPFRYAVYIMLGLVTSAAIACFFDNLFICYPVTALIEPYYMNKCIDQAAVFLSTLVINLIFDILILLMPIPVVLGLQLPTRGKIQVLGMFLLGAIVVGAGIARMVQLLEVNEKYLDYANDVTYWTSPAIFWANIELSIAVVAACLPTLKPLVHYFFPPAAKTQSSRQSNYIKVTNDFSVQSEGTRDRDSIPLNHFRDSKRERERARDRADDMA